MKVEEIIGPELRKMGEIVPTRKEWIEGLQIPLVGVAIATCDVGVHHKPRPPRKLSERVARISRHRPGFDVGPIEAAKLIGKLPVPVPNVRPAPQSGSKGVARLRSTALLVYCLLVVNAQVVEINVQVGVEGAISHCVNTPEGPIGIGAIIEDTILVLGQISSQPAHVPSWHYDDGANGIEASSDVQTFGDRDQALGTETYLLASPPDDTLRLVYNRKGNLTEELLNIEFPLVYRACPPLSALGECTAKLGEGSEVSGEMKVGVEDVTM